MLMMIFRFIALLVRPPKRGDQYFGNSVNFVTSRWMEKVWFGMKHESGENIWLEVPGENTYRLTVTSIQPSYYICEAEVLAMLVTADAHSWLTRKIERRISKLLFKKLIVDGTIKRIC